MDEQALLRAQHERWSDPQTQADAQERAAKVQIPRKPLENGLAAMRRAPKIEQRIFWLRQMATRWAAAVEPHAACKPGCSACCHQTVMVTEAEAKLIARETGAAYRHPVQWRGVGQEDRLAFEAKPCTFLAADGRCSIYEHRPMACRLLFNLDRDALLCQIVPGSPMHVPYANSGAIDMAYLEAHIDMGAEFRRFQAGGSLDEAARSLRWADLREFFPDGLS